MCECYAAEGECVYDTSCVTAVYGYDTCGDGGVMVYA